MRPLFLSVLSLLLIADEATCGDCAEELRAAQEHYEGAAFDRAIDRAAACLNDPDLPDEVKIEAYQLMALSHIGMERHEQARDPIGRILAIDDKYRADPLQHPPAYVALVEDMKDPPGGIKKWLLIGAGAVVAGVAVVAASGGGGDDGAGGGATSIADPPDLPQQ